MNSDPSDTVMLVDRPELRAQHVAAILTDLVRTRSVNPADPEVAMAERVIAHLAGTRWEVTRVETEPGRPSVAAVLPGTTGTPRLVLNGHLDTVPVGDLDRWTVDPFAGQVRDGAVWGRGTTDMKGGLACQIACAQALSALPPLSGTLILHFAMGEELGEPGTRSLLAAGFTGDYGIVTEPTDMRVAVAQRGTLWCKITIHGRATHAGTRDLGDNPILRLPALLDALTRHDKELSAFTDPRYGRPLCTPTIVRAGATQNVVPETAEVLIDRRLLPSESATTALEQLRRMVDTLNTADPASPYELDDSVQNWKSTEVAADSPLVELAQKTVTALTGEAADSWCTPYGSDVTDLVEAGIEAITLGPGDPNGCHAPDERCSVQRLEQCSQALTHIAIGLLG